MRATLALLGLVAVAACDGPPPFTLKFQITQGDSYACYQEGTDVRATTCDQVTMLCDAVVSIRIVPPSDPTTPYISLCKPLAGRKDACAIAGVDLPQPSVPVPEQRLRVEMAVYPADVLPIDDVGDPLCPPPSSVQFAADGYPVTQLAPCDATITDPDDPMFCWPIPAIGGTAMYSPGDAETVVDLGCTDFSQLEACAATTAVDVTASVNDFDTQLSVSPATADRLAVSVGEPKPSGAEYFLNPTDTTALSRVVVQPVPAWGGRVESPFLDTACLQVLEDGAQSAASVRCKGASADQTSIDLTGVRIAKASLEQILAAQGRTLSTFPEPGLVIGIVLDYLGNPVANVKVSTSSSLAHVEYLSADRNNIIVGGTSASGIFLSSDAPFGTVFSAQSSSVQAATALGGLISGKVTIVVLQFKPPVGG